MGMTMGEIFYVKELAEDCATDKVYEFLFVAPAIPITGAVGSPTTLWRLNKAPTMAKMTGAQCLADMLAGYGVSHVFMVPAVLRRTFAEMETRTKIKRIHTHGEKSAAYMADGYAAPRASPACAWRR